MTLEQFAKQAGVKIVWRDKTWGGPVAYTTADNPSATFCGYRSEHAAYNAWLADTFGKHAAGAVKKLLRETERAQ